MIWKYILLFLATRYCFPVIGIGINVTEVQILKKKLFENYDREIKHTANTDQPILVLLSFSLLSVFELDMKQQALSTLIVFKISWKDELLKWNKTQYNGLDKLTVTLQSVWKPDIIILNSIDKHKTLINYGDDTNYVTINSDGRTKWNVYVNLETRCKVITNITHLKLKPVILT
ncbi:CHRNA10 [Mytilus coruscus]|uniref:CHRNA10 n=1 Tax=Mytilus coruscus TaxID=42192 RepID=A0A6J8E428_MYTCO|nr:CHRNA10 [Mytilus coruscus]